MVGREGKDHLGGTSHEVTARLLGLDSSKQSEQVHQHHTMSELGLVIEAVDLTTILGDSGERKDVVEIEVESGVDVVDEGLDILLGGLVERHDGEGGSAATMGLEDSLVLLNGLPAVARSGDDNVSATGEETLKNLNTDRSLANTGKESVLVLERGTRSSDLVQDVKVDASEVARILPLTGRLPLQVEERDLVGRQRGGQRSHLGAKELRRRATASGCRMGLATGL